jgi:hypothetical protein
MANADMTIAAAQPRLNPMCMGVSHKSNDEARAPAECFEGPPHELWAILREWAFVCFFVRGAICPFLLPSPANSCRSVIAWHRCVANGGKARRVSVGASVATRILHAAQRKSFDGIWVGTLGQSITLSEDLHAARGADSSHGAER